jgi:hypothetical protein
VFYVERLVDDDIERVEIEIGVQDASHSEVLRGLEEGDQLLIGGTSMIDRLRVTMS